MIVVGTMACSMEQTTAAFAGIPEFSSGAGNATAILTGTGMSGGTVRDVTVVTGRDDKKLS